jgi:hypothetical protein
MRRSTAGVLGFAVAPLISAVILSATTRLVDRFDIVARIGMVPVFYFFSALATIVLGLPAFLLFSRFGMVRWWSILGSGLLIGALMGAIVGKPNRAQVPDMLLMAAGGTVAALGFWLIWRQGQHANAASS